MALLEIKNKEFKLTPIPLRTVRPFVIDEVVLEDAAEEEGLDVNDTVEIGKWLRLKVPIVLPWRLRFSFLVFCSLLPLLSE